MQAHDNVILASISNGPYGNTIAVVKEDPVNCYVQLIGTLDKRDSERLNHLATPALGGAFRPRGGPRVGSRFAPFVHQAFVSPFSPQFNNTYPPNYGQAGPGPAPHIMIYVDI